MFFRLPQLLSLTSPCILVLLAACSPKDTPKAGGGGGGQTVPVVAATVVQKSMPLELPAIGNVRAMASVAVKPRVSGQIAKVHFTEGQDVKEGDVLASIDPAPFEVALAQAKARLAQAQTQADIAATQAERYSALVGRGAVAREEVDQLVSTANAAKSNAEAAAASVKEAELRLSYCTVKSPLTGRAGRRAVDSGNVVKEDETTLVVINQLKPIEVIFSVPEQHFSEIARFSAQGQLNVSISPNGSASRAITGHLTFIDNAIKSATGTLEVKATMPNEDLSLWPGQYGEVRLTLTVDPNALVVPATAVQTGQEGQYVFVINDEMKAQIRPVVMERTVGTEAIIRSGVKAGEQVVVDGQLRITTGSKVQIKPPVGQPAPPAGTGVADARETPIP